MSTFLRQVCTLVTKTLLLTVVRRPIATLVRVLVYPVVLILVLSYAQFFLNPQQSFGVGTPSPIYPLSVALPLASPSRDTLAFVHSNLTGGPISAVIDTLAATSRRAGKNVRLLSSEDELPGVCKSSGLSSSNCNAAVIFHTSYNEPVAGGVWNYTIKTDASLGLLQDVTSSVNDAQVYLLPLQLAIDQAIATVTPNANSDGLQNVNQMIFTAADEPKRVQDTRMSYWNGLIHRFGVVFFFALLPVVYHSVGLMASEREAGLSQLIEAMMPNAKRWTPLLVRLVAHHLSFDILYGLGWLTMGMILAALVFVQTSPAIIIGHHVLVGLSLSSFALFGGAFFRKAQLSSVAVTVIITLLAIVPQVLPGDQTGSTVTALLFVFPSSNYYYFLSLMAKWEFEGHPTNLLEVPPGNQWEVSGITFFPALIFQIVVYPILAVVVERMMHGTASKGRTVFARGDESGVTVRLRDFRKTYRPSELLSLFRRPIGVEAVKGLSLEARKGEILVLLGPNGSGKSTTLDAVAGLSTITGGSIDVDGTGGLGIAPQQNVMWADLTVEEHVRIFQQLKNASTSGGEEKVRSLVTACDLTRKAYAKSGTLSGGQKRKLQLAMMFAGGSAVCCVDEVSSGLDPVSRRKVWDILMAERGDRTIIMTTHFLDEADYLSDQVVILANGVLKAQGSSVELKDRLGDGYKICLSHEAHPDTLLRVEGVGTVHAPGLTTYSTRDAAQATLLLGLLEQSGFRDYCVAGPTLEDVFLKLAGSAAGPEDSLSPPSSPRSMQSSCDSLRYQKGVAHPTSTPTSSVAGELMKGQPIGAWQQLSILYQKRILVMKRNYLPYLAACTIALIGAGVSTLLLKDYTRFQCTLSGVDPPPELNLATAYNLKQVVIGPESRVDSHSLAPFVGRYFKASPIGTVVGLAILLSHGLRTVNDSHGFRQVISQSHADLNPGGIFLGEQSHLPMIAWTADTGMLNPLILQNLLDSTLAKTDIITNYSVFDLQPRYGFIEINPLLFVSYFVLVFACYPAFFALYPTVERLRRVRALQYSNGVRLLPLWLAHLLFDAFFVLLISTFSIALLALGRNPWAHLPLLWVVFVLYGLSSTLLSYVGSMIARTPLAAWAICVAVQTSMFAVYLGAHLGVAIKLDPAMLMSSMSTIHFVVGLFSPAANLAHALFVALGLFGLNCGGEQAMAPNLYGSSILYLILQCLALSGVLLWLDCDVSIAALCRRSQPAFDPEKSPATGPADPLDETGCAKNPRSGLCVSHLSKSFGDHLAVDDVSFSVQPGEVFALLGPNGAGKSTTISLIRGDTPPSSRSSQILLSSTSVLASPTAARSRLGVCPQFDALDVMTVSEQVLFYARIRGVPSASHNVSVLLSVLGLTGYRDTLAYHLSGGTARKLSLAIALIGDPSVLLLDEPSTGLDAASKRVMWRVLGGLARERAVVLTTHSMEEADALADRAGILKGRMLAMGGCEQLRKRGGEVHHVRLVMGSAPFTDAGEVRRVREWVERELEGGVVEEGGAGQVRVRVPAGRGALTIGEIMGRLEASKERLAVRFYSIGETTLDEVFVDLVRRHGGEEDGVEGGRKKRWVS